MDVPILGVAARLPGAPDIESLWRNLAAGRCAIREIDENRFSLLRYWHPLKPLRGKTYARHAGLVDDPYGFDAAFFGMSPREAQQLDPQQRWLLETGWSALEEAGAPQRDMAAERIGVFVGASSLDFANLAVMDARFADAHFMTGSTLSILSNRLSTVFGFKGPSMTIDTACSSSLHALTEATAALREGRIDLALVCGVNALMSPFPFIGFSQATMLSPSGRCRAFGASPDGYVRGEGAVSLVLARPGLLEDRAMGHVLAAVVSSDGPKNLISVPSRDGQLSALRGALDEAGVTPDDFAFVEAHGTGTAVGDPIEAGALGEALGARRSKPLPIGSIKSNIGHLEPGSGLAGVAKALLALRAGVLPPSLFAEEPNPDIDFDALNLSVATEPQALAGQGARVAGVNSFGFGGTNAHVVLRAPERGEETAPPCAAPAPLVITAQSEEALRELAASYAGRVAALPDEAAYFGLAQAAAARRSALSNRLAVAAGSRSEAERALRTYAASGAEAPGVSSGVAAPHAEARALAFVFSGNGAQWAGMAIREMAADADFEQRLRRVDEPLSALTGWSTLEMLGADDLTERLRETSVAQPLLFAIQAALTDQLLELGLSPHTCFGHSVGEIAAAYAAGALSLDGACRLVVARSALQEAARGKGGMAVLSLGAEDAEKLMAREGFDALEVACVNTERNVTIAGVADQLEALEASAARGGWTCKRLDLEYPFHSRLLEPLKSDFLSRLENPAPQAARCLFVSSVDGRALEPRALDAEYWWRNLREPVRFADAVDAAIELGVEATIEIGPKPALKSYVRAGFARAQQQGAVIASFVETGVDRNARTARDVLASAMAHGASMRPAENSPRLEGRIALPSTPWRRRAHDEEIAEARAGFQSAHPLLGWAAATGSDLAAFEVDLDVSTHPFLQDHRVDDRVVFPGAGFIENALAAARLALPDDALELKDFQILAALILEPDAPQRMRTRIAPDRRSVLIESRSLQGEADAWTLHARGRLAPRVERPAFAWLDEPSVRRWDQTEIYTYAAARSLDYGAGFRLVDHMHKRRFDRFTLALAAERAPQGAEIAPERARPFEIHPSLLDAALHGLFVVVDEPEWRAHPDHPYVPVHIERLALYRPGAAVTRAALLVRRSSVHSVVVDVELYGPDGDSVLRAEGFRLRASPIRLREDPAELCFIERSVAFAPAEGGGAHSAVFAALDALEPSANGFDAAEAEARQLLEAGAIGAEIAFLRDRAAVGDAEGPGARWEGLAATATASSIASIDRSGRRPTVSALIEPPDPQAMIAAAVGCAPAVAASAALLARVVELEGNAVQESSAQDGALRLPAPLVDQHLTMGPWARRRSDAVARLAVTALGAQPSGRSLRVAVLGARDLAPVEALLAQAGSALRVTVMAEDDRLRSAAARRFSGEPRVQAAVFEADAGPARAFDLVLDFGQARRPAPPEAATGLLSPGGVGVVASPGRNHFDDLVFSAEADWFEADAGDLGRSPLLTRDQWLARAEAAAAARVRAVDLGEAGYVCVSALAAGPETAAATEPVAEAVACIGAALGAAPPAWLLERAGPTATTDAAYHVFAFGDGALTAPAEALAEFGAAAAEAARRALDGAGAERLIALMPEHGDAWRPLRRALQALSRTVMNEHEGLRVAPLVAGDATAFDVALAEYRRAVAEAEERCADGRVGRVVPVRTPRRAAPPDRRRVLDVARRGALDSLYWREEPRVAPGAGEIEIKIRATGLNFRDVMWAMNLLPDEALEHGFSGPTLGFECCGEVTAAGDGVEGVSEGDLVLAFGSDLFASHATLPAFAAARLPKDVDPAAAATMPVAHLTARYALVDLARLQPGETVLIHGAAGGVGLAAIAIAKQIGARVVASAGSPEKRALLRALGVDAVVDSREGRFVEQTLAFTDGVDVVLNSLAKEAMEQSVGLLRPFGRFCELGKRDFFEDSDLALRAFSRNLSYFGIDLDQVLAREGAVRDGLLAALSETMVGSGRNGLPIRRFPASGAVEAFRLMQRSGHVGKIVVDAPDENEVLPTVDAARSAARWRFDPEASHLIVGGLGGFGAVLARWMVRRGARRLVLMSRSGADDPKRAADVSALQALGAEVSVQTGDAADEAALRAALEAARAMGPLKSVFHVAMVLDDRLLADQSYLGFQKVLAPKVSAAALLDQLTEADPLDRFVLFSSATTLFGNPGQANYVAANGYLEGLARRRRAQGKPALAPAWGAVGDVGVLAREEATAEILKRRLGEATIAAEQGLDALERYALEYDDGAPESAAPIIGKFEWRRAAKELPLLQQALFAPMAERFAGGDDATGDLAERVAGLSAEDAVALVSGLLRTEVAAVLRLSAVDVPVDRPLMELGLDSLMAVELSVTIQERYGVDVPVAALSQASTLTALSEALLKRVGHVPGAESSDAAVSEKHLLSDEDRRLMEAARREVQGERAA